MRYIIILVILLSQFSVFAQKDNKDIKQENTEVKDPIKFFKIDESYNNKKQEIKGRQAIVDINSNLTIHLKKDKITAYLAEKLDNNKIANTQLQTLNKVLESEIKILKLLSIKVDSQSDPKKKLQELGTYSVIMSEFYNSVLEIPELRDEVNRLAGEYFQKRSNLNKELYPNVESYIVRNLSVFNEKSIKGLQNGTLNRVNIMLRAYLQAKNGERRKVHIINFDNYASGEYYEVPRWVTSFSQQDQAAYQQATRLSLQANELISGNTNRIRDILSNQIQAIDAFKILIDSISEIQKNKDQFFGNTSTHATEYLDKINAQVIKIYRQLNDLKNVPSGANYNVLELYNQSINSFISLSENFISNLQQFSTQLPESLTKDTHIRNLQTEINNCGDAIKSDVTKIKILKQLIIGMLQPFARGNQSIIDAAGDTYKQAISDLPDDGYIDLKTTGKRLNGEIITFALSYQVKKDSSKLSEEVQFESSQLTMQLIDFYSVSSVSVVLAHPFNSSDKVTLDRNYQFAPAASLLLKFGSRTSNLWNNLSPGIGVVLATPDFDKDGSPDFSFGAITSIFRDVLSFGISYNTRTDSPFTHIGLSIPFNVFGGVQTTTASK